MRTLVRLVFSLALALLVLPLTTAAQTAQGTAFTYQGQLLQNNAPVTGSTDMTFTLWDAATGGNPIGAALPFTAGSGNPVSVQNGVFTVALDFGPSAFNTLISDERWLAVTIGSIALSPRTKIENAPYALQSRAAELAYSVSNNSIGSVQIIATQVQKRVSGSCAAGSAISVINQDGTVSCQSSGGTITGVTAGTGLSGGGNSGTVSLSADTTYLQRRVTATCASGSSISAVNSDGTVACQPAGTSFALPYSATQSSAGPLFNVTNTDTSSASTALQGTSNSTAANVSAVEGVISSTSPGLFSAGVRGVNNSTNANGNGIGVYGTNAGYGPGVNGTSVNGIGVVALSSNGVGVYASSSNYYSAEFQNTNSSNPASPLYVSTNHASAAGISSYAVGDGVYGGASGAGGRGIVGESTETTTANSWNSPNPPSGPVGVYGTAQAPSGIGVEGVSTSASTAAFNFGVVGQGGGTQGIGMAGFGQIYGIYGALVGSSTGAGVFADGGTGQGIYVQNNSPYFTAWMENDSGGPVLKVRSGSVAASFDGQVLLNTNFAQNGAVELTIKGNDPSNTNADITLLPYNGFTGFNISANASRFSVQTTNGSNYSEMLGVDTAGNLQIAGNAYKPGGGSWIASSDRRIKQDIGPIAGAVDTLLKLRPVSFRYTPEYRALENNFPDRPYFGFIAQDFRDVFPDAVSSTGKRVPGSAPGDEPILALDSSPALITAVAAVQELAVQSKGTEDEITALRTENAALRVRLEHIEARLDAVGTPP